MQVLFAVLDDLFQFALRSLFGAVSLESRNKLVEDLSKPLQPLLPLLSPARNKIEDFEFVGAGSSSFITVKTTSVRSDPVLAYDNVLMTLSYGASVQILRYGGRWALVQTGDISGWVLKDDISSTAEKVFPRFMMGVAYDANHITTKKLRLLIKDEFACSEPALPLTGSEYVSYRLQRKQRQIVWPLKRPRLAGQWQSILRGQPGIHIGVLPKTGSVMECVRDNEGFLLFVEAVFPDESIQVSAVDYDGTGVYSENVFTKEVWQGLRPIFMEVN